MNVPATILIGTKNPKLDLFDDAKKLKDMGEIKKINAIRVYHTDK